MTARAFVSFGGDSLFGLLIRSNQRFGLLLGRCHFRAPSSMRSRDAAAEFSRTRIRVDGRRT